MRKHFLTGLSLVVLMSGSAFSAPNFDQEFECIALTSNLLGYPIHGSQKNFQKIKSDYRKLDGGYLHYPQVLAVFGKQNGLDGFHVVTAHGATFVKRSSIKPEQTSEKGKYSYISYTDKIGENVAFVVAESSAVSLGGLYYNKEYLHVKLEENETPEPEVRTALLEEIKRLLPGVPAGVQAMHAEFEKQIKWQMDYAKEHNLYTEKDGYASFIKEHIARLKREREAGDAHLTAVIDICSKLSKDAPYQEAIEELRKFKDGQKA